MITIKTKYLGGLRTESTHVKSGNKLISDAPTDNNGKGEAFSPTDLTCTSLVTCMLTVMGIYGNKNGFDLGEVEADVEKVMAAEPRRISKITITLRFKSKFDKATQDKLKEKALHCPVALSLHPDIRQNILFNF